MRHSKIILVMGLLLLLVIGFSRCGTSSPSQMDARGEQYAGVKACMDCHSEVAAAYMHTNHYKTSSAVDSDSLQKQLSLPDTAFHYNDASVVRIREEGHSLLQELWLAGKMINSGPLDIAFGSGEKAQTYAGWKEGKLLQLPLTFFRNTNSWLNSPGFPASHANFNRVIVSRCFECHASFIDKENVQEEGLRVSEKLDRNSIIYGIDCERCHGPAAAHVQFHRANPSVKESNHMKSIKGLSRRQQLDLCGVCHSGNDLTAQRSLFGFLPGDTLANFYFPEFGSSSNEPDVHGKQLQLLQSSKCFQQSQMTCGSCHDPHRPERDKQDIFITKCMSCHQNSLHAQDKMRHYLVEENPKKENCISCHMPLQVSRAISFKTGDSNNVQPYLLRTHRVAVYKNFP